MQPIDIKKVMLWNTFKEKFLLALEDAPPFEVDLAFEYKDAYGTIVSYSSNDPLYIHDIKLSGTGKMCFEVPNDSTTRFVELGFAEMISNDKLGPLESFVTSCYTEALKELDLSPSFPTIKSFLLSLREEESMTKIVNVLNNSGEYISETIQMEKDKKNFQTLDGFGMF